MNDPQKQGLHVLTIRYPFVVFEQRSWQPFLNIYETEQALVVVVELAGVDPSSLNIDVEAHLVRIRGNRNVRPPDHLRRIDRMEITSGPFHIEIPLNRAVNPQQTESYYQQGLLQIVLPFTRHSTQRVVIKVMDRGQE